MVRTKGGNSDPGRKAVAAKAPRKQLGGGSSSSGAGGSLTSPAGKNKYGGGNPVRWWPTPSWQKGVADFFSKETETNEILQNADEDRVSSGPSPSNASPSPGTSSASSSPGPSNASSSPGPSSTSSSPGPSSTHPGVSTEELGIECLEED